MARPAYRLFSEETLAAALISDKDVSRQASISIWPFLDLLVGQDKKSREDAHAVWSKLVDAGLDVGVGEYTPATQPEVEAVRDAAKRASGAQNTKLYEAVVEHLPNVDADAVAAAIASFATPVRKGKGMDTDLPGVKWSLFDALLAAAVRAMAAAPWQRRPRARHCAWPRPPPDSVACTRPRHRPARPRASTVPREPDRRPSSAGPGTAISTRSLYLST